MCRNNSVTNIENCYVHNGLDPVGDVGVILFFHPIVLCNAKISIHF